MLIVLYDIVHFCPISGFLKELHIYLIFITPGTQWALAIQAMFTLYLWFELSCIELPHRMLNNWNGSQVSLIF